MSQSQLSPKNKKLEEDNHNQEEQQRKRVSSFTSQFDFSSPDNHTIFQNPKNTQIPIISQNPQSNRPQSMNFDKEEQEPNLLHSQIQSQSMPYSGPDSSNSGPQSQQQAVPNRALLSSLNSYLKPLQTKQRAVKVILEKTENSSDEEVYDPNNAGSISSSRSQGSLTDSDVSQRQKKRSKNCNSSNNFKKQNAASSIQNQFHIPASLQKKSSLAAYNYQPRQRESFFSNIKSSHSFIPQRQSTNTGIKIRPSLLHDSLKQTHNKLGKNNFTIIKSGVNTTNVSQQGKNGYVNKSTFNSKKDQSASMSMNSIGKQGKLSNSANRINNKELLHSQIVVPNHNQINQKMDKSEQNHYAPIINDSVNEQILNDNKKDKIHRKSLSMTQSQQNFRINHISTANNLNQSKSKAQINNKNHKKISQTGLESHPNSKNLIEKLDRQDNPKKKVRDRGIIQSHNQQRDRPVSIHKNIDQNSKKKDYFLQQHKSSSPKKQLIVLERKSSLRNKSNLAKNLKEIAKGKEVKVVSRFLKQKNNYNQKIRFIDKVIQVKKKVYQNNINEKISKYKPMLQKFIDNLKDKIKERKNKDEISKRMETFKKMGFKGVIGEPNREQEEKQKRIEAERNFMKKQKGGVTADQFLKEGPGTVFTHLLRPVSKIDLQIYTNSRFAEQVQRFINLKKSTESLRNRPLNSRGRANIRGDLLGLDSNQQSNSPRRVYNDLGESFSDDDETLKNIEQGLNSPGFRKKKKTSDYLNLMCQLDRVEQFREGKNLKEANKQRLKMKKINFIYDSNKDAKFQNVVKNNMLRRAREDAREQMADELTEFVRYYKPVQQAEMYFRNSSELNKEIQMLMQKTQIKITQATAQGWNNDKFGKIRRAGLFSTLFDAKSLGHNIQAQRREEANMQKEMSISSYDSVISMSEAKMERYFEQMRNLEFAINELDRKKLLTEDEKNIRERIIDAQQKVIAAIQNTLKLKEEQN